MKRISKNIYRRFFMLASLNTLLFFPTYINAQDETEGSKFKMEITFIKEDTVKKVKALITAVDSLNSIKPFKGAEVKFFVKKSFGLLPIGEEGATTDENGEAVIEFPTDLPGDSVGNVQVVAKVEDNEELGALQTIKIINWGKPIINDRSFYRRALWASGANAPLPLVFIVTSMVLLVWGVIFFIIRQLFKIQKL